MKITLFTSNQARHKAYINELSKISSQLYVIMECTSIHPGKTNDFFKKSLLMQEYFSHVMQAEKNVFGEISFLPNNVKTFPIKMGDINETEIHSFQEALDSDIYLVFGSSYIRGILCDFLIEHNAINIHMGISPYYRGSSTNFWAMYNEQYQYVGATIHRLSKDLDAGDILYHAFPARKMVDPFTYGMLTVKSAQISIIENILKGSLLNIPSIKQDKSKEIKYTKNSDFTDAIVKDYLNNLPTKERIYEHMAQIDWSEFINPYFY